MAFCLLSLKRKNFLQVDTFPEWKQNSVNGCLKGSKVFPSRVDPF